MRNRSNAIQVGLFLFGFAYAWFFSQGIPLWDDDFTSWFWKIKDRQITSIVWEWISPVSTQPEHWGFNERPLQALIYKLGYAVSGYESWSYFLFKNAVYGALGVMIYLWGLRLVPESLSPSRARTAALAVAILFLVAPAPMAAHVMYADFAPIAELIFLGMTYLLWAAVEKTPAYFSGSPRLSNPEHRRWLLKMSLLSFCTYLGYKSKADLKVIPLVLAVYVAIVRRAQWRFFAIPVALMLLLAVPWGREVFEKLPPFLPGSKGSEVGWMFQPASLDRLIEFFWSSQSHDFVTSLRAPTMSLAAVLGPFLLIPLLLFLLWRIEAFDKVHWTRLKSSSDRSRLFVLIWFVAITLAVSALPALNYSFRIRYGILPWVPVSILLAWVFGLFADSLEKLPRGALALAIVCLALQGGINVSRSIQYRRELGQVMIGVDRAYEYFSKNHPREKLVLAPDFRPYDYRPDAPDSVRQKVWVKTGEELQRRSFEKDHTYLLSWKPAFWEKVELVGHFPGCRETSVFDLIFGCAPGTGAFLMRYIGENSDYARGEALRQKGDWDGALREFDHLLNSYPGSLLGQFARGMTLAQKKDWPSAQDAFARLELVFPMHPAVLYNHALAFEGLSNYASAIERLRKVAALEPLNSAALVHLYFCYEKAGESRLAGEVLAGIQKSFPDDPEVNRILAGIQESKL